MVKLNREFYSRPDVVKIAKDLLGKVLVTQWDGVLTTGRIVETEAYNGVVDKASHAWGGRRTNRTMVMYEQGGLAYVYLCYGIHHLFNVVTNTVGTPHAVLIRALEPLTGIEHMLQRRNKPKADVSLASGPGNVCVAMGISTQHTGLNLLDDAIYIADDGYKLSKKNIKASVRIGVDYAAEDALLPYRFTIRDSKYVSGGRKWNK